jgi:hypothetical protein
MKHWPITPHYVVPPSPRDLAREKAATLTTALNEAWPDGKWDVEPEGEGFCAKATGTFKLRFQDMPRMAEIFGTESLDFGHIEQGPSYHYDSGCLDGDPGAFVVWARGVK